MSNQTDTTEHSNITASASGTAHPAHVAFGDEDSSGGLVFGEVEDEVFSTPLAVTRASSRAVETPHSADDATFHSPHSTSPPGHTPAGNAAELAAAALQQQFPEASIATDSTASAGEPSTGAAADQTVELLEHASEVNVSTSDSGDKDDASSTPEPHLEPAAPAAAVTDSPTTAAADSDRQTAAVADAAELTAVAGSSGSGLLSLAELTLNSSSNSSSRDQAVSQMQPNSPSSPSAMSSTSSDTAAPATANAAAAAAEWAVAGDSADASASQPAAAAAVTGSSLAASPAAAGSPRGRGSTVRLSPPCSPIKTHSSGGLDRAPSWQLQHAAAAAAGTAAHPAPPRSDMDLTRLR